jgi:predicted lipoprotein with Yx(FWY)xxD motif
MADPTPLPYTAPNPAEISVLLEGGRYVFRTDEVLPVYTYDRDHSGQSSCEALCAQTWRPLAAPASATIVGDWTAIERSDHSRQWAYKGKPVYTYVKDRPGIISGDGIDGLWHVLSP